MQLRENFTMENNNARNNTVVPGTQVYSSKTGIMQITKTTLLLFISVFICSLVAVGLIVYNFAVCPSEFENKRICDNPSYYHITSNLSKNSLSEASKLLETSIDTSTTSSNVASVITAKENTTKVDVRLPRAIRPISYDLKLVPFLIVDNFTFKGETQIKIRVLEDCMNITLHSVQLKIQDEDVSVHKLTDNDQEDQEIPKRLQYFVDEKQFFVIELKEKLLKDSEYLLKIRYTGILNDYLQGFYRSSYTVGNETRWLATTQFQPTDARRAFPSFDGKFGEFLILLES